MTPRMRCPHCQSELSTLPHSGACPRCAAVLLDPKGADASNKTIDVRSPLAGDGGNPRRRAPADSVAGDALNKTIDLGSLPGSDDDTLRIRNPVDPLAADVLSKTVHLRGAADEGVSIELVDDGPVRPVGTATVTGGATIEFGAPVSSDVGATVELPTKRPTVTLGNERTIDLGSTIAPDDAENLGATWGPKATRTLRQDQTIQLDSTSIDDDGGGGESPASIRQSTIRIGQTVSGFRSTLPIKARSLSDSANFRTLQVRADGAPRALIPVRETPDYELLEILGQGGMGVVYAAKQSSIARTVAVKMLKKGGKKGTNTGSSIGDADQRDKFIAEAVITGELEHPNIVPIYDLGANDEGALFYSMKRVKGTPWDDVIRTKPLSENLAILMRVADAVAFAHANGVVHRDLKPENVMLGDYGEVLVMDWGLARVTADFPCKDSVYQLDNLGGTPAYMAPEMARGPVESIDARSDVYLLGAILYEIVAGKPPHTGRDVMACLMAAAMNQIQPVENAAENELARIALRAMATEQADRHQSVKELQAAIAEFQSHTESLMLSGGAQRSLDEALGSGDYEMYSRALHGFEESLLLWGGNDRARHGRHAARIDYARAALANGDFDLADSLLARAVSESCPETFVTDLAELRSQIDAARIERDARQARLKNAKRLALALLLGIVGVSSVSALAVWRQNGIAEAKRAEAEEQRTEAAKQRDIADAKRIEADQQRALAVKNEALAQANEVKAVAAQRSAEYEEYVAQIGLAASKVGTNAFRDGLALLQACPTPDRNWEWGRLRYLCDLSERVLELGPPVDAVAYSPDGSRVATADWNGRVVAFDATTGERVWAAGPRDPDASAALYAHAVAYSPDGARIASAWSDHRVRILDTRTGEVEATLDGHTEAVLSVAFSPDGKRLASGGYDDAVIVWDLATGAPTERLRGHNWWVWSVAFAPDGEAIASASQDGTVVVWRRGAKGFERSTAFTGHKGPVFAVAFHPNGETVASAGDDRVVRRWSASEAKPADLARRLEGLPDPAAAHREYAGHSEPVRALAFSADGMRLVSGSQDNTLRVWDLARGDSLALRGHGGRVRGVAFAPDGDHVASAAQDGQARLWDIGRYLESRVLRARPLDGHDDAVLAARFSPDGARVVTASRDRTARVWDATTGKRLATLEEGHAFLASSAVPYNNGRSLASAAGDNTVRLWDIGNGVERHSLAGTGRSAALAVDPDGRLLATGGANNTVRLWDPQTGSHVIDLEQHTVDVTAVAIADDTRLVASGDERGVILLWRRGADGEWTVAAKLAGHSRQITALRFTKGGERLVSSSGDRTVGQWDVAAATELRGLVLKHPEWVAAMDVSDNGELSLTACDDGVARLWRLSDASEVARWAPATPDGGLPTVYTSVDLAPSEDSSGPTVALLATASTGAVDRWVIDPSQTDQSPQPVVKLSGAGSLWSARFANDPLTLITVGGNDARVWRLDQAVEGRSPAARPVVRLSPHGSVADAAISPDGALVATGSWDSSAKLWDAATGRPVRKLDGGHKGFVNAVAFSPDGAEVATAGDDGAVRFWSVADGALADRMLAGHTGRVLAIDYSAGGERVLTVSSDRTARLWDAKSGKELRRFTGHDQGLLDGDLSPDGSRVATASEDNTARVWDAGTGRLLAELRGHSAAVNAVAFSPDGRRLLTGGDDNAAKVWDAVNFQPSAKGGDPAVGKEVLSLTGHTAEVTSVGFSPNGRAALTGSRDGAAIVWPAADWR
ncbi:MAG: protein kinase domain-containing protein [Lacipirellulaceae bacterium]